MAWDKSPSKACSMDGIAGPFSSRRDGFCGVVVPERDGCGRAGSACCLHSF